MENQELSDYEKGIIVGLLASAGHFGGDGRYPQITMKMHIRHRDLLEWLRTKIPGSKLYGPYNHGGRNYFQLMVRGKPLIDFLLSLLLRVPWEKIDGHSYMRMRKMLEIYVKSAP